MKRCPVCKLEKPVDSFSPRAKGLGLAGECKTCHAAKAAARRLEIQLELAETLHEKYCWRCERTLDIDHFAWREDRSKGRRAACNECEHPDGKKTCKICGERKPKEQFNRSGNSVQSYCKECTPMLLREWRWRTEYGLTVEDVQRMLDDQDSACAICLEKFAGTSVMDFDFKIDHCHDTGRLRKLLCDLCNRGIGMLKHSPALLRAAALYIEEAG